MARSSSGSKPAVKGMERVTNKAPRGRQGAAAKPGEYAMKREVNPVRKGRAGGSVKEVGGFAAKRKAIRAKKK